MLSNTSRSFRIALVIFGAGLIALYCAYAVAVIECEAKRCVSLHKESVMYQGSCQCLPKDRP